MKTSVRMYPVVKMNAVKTDDDCTNNYEFINGNECINSLRSNLTNEDNIILETRNYYD